MSKKPYIARDTGEPLVVMGGYHVGSDGGLIHKPIDTSAPIPGPAPDDIALLDKHGIDGLEAMGFHGVIDRLSRRTNS